MDRNLTFAEKNFFLNEFKEFLLSHNWNRTNDIRFEKKHTFDYHGMKRSVILEAFLTARRWRFNILIKNKIILTKSGFYKALVKTINKGYCLLEFYYPDIIGKDYKTLKFTFKQHTNTITAAILKDLEKMEKPNG